MIRVRFAPSPTGNLHIGGARTALFNWLYARARGGKFILRIEDTDLARSKKEFLDEILNSLKWMGLDWDELYHQGERFEIYREYANQLLVKGLAYRSKKVEEDGTVSPNSTAEAIIFKVNPQKIKINDLIHGEIEFDSTVIKDQVLIKSDGSPTYNFACVVDDAAMKITDIIRGDDHISNTPKQIILYNALGFKIPEFAHIPLILGTEGGRLSKRTGATAISEYRTLGYLSSALVNYLLLLGWSPGGNEELIELSEAVKKFDIKNANKTAAAFNLEKLNWINAQYIRKISAEKLLELAWGRLSQKYPLGDFDKKYLISAVRLFQERVNTLNELGDFSDFFFAQDVEINLEAKKRLAAKDYSAEFSALLKRLVSIENWTRALIEEAFRGLVKDLNIKAGELVHPVRAALTGKTIGPGLFELMEVLGKEKVEKRLGVFIK